MGGRYLISGTQLGLLKAQAEDPSIIDMCDRIEEDQFVTNSDDDVVDDVAEWRNKLEK